LREKGEIVNSFLIAGWRGSFNSGFIVFTLAPWDERERSQQEIGAEIGRLAATIPGMRTFIGQPNSLGIRDAGSGLQFAIAGDDYDELSEAAAKVMEGLEQDGRFGRVRLSY